MSQMGFRFTLWSSDFKHVQFLYKPNIGNFKLTFCYWRSILNSYKEKCRIKNEGAKNERFQKKILFIYFPYWHFDDVTFKLINIVPTVIVLRTKVVIKDLDIDIWPDCYVTITITGEDTNWRKLFKIKIGSQNYANKGKTS